MSGEKVLFIGTECFPIFLPFLGHEYVYKNQNDVFLYNIDDGKEFKILSNDTLVRFFTTTSSVQKSSVLNISFLTHNVLLLICFLYLQDTYNSSEAILSPDKKFALLQYNYEKVAMILYFYPLGIFVLIKIVLIFYNRSIQTWQF